MIPIVGWSAPSSAPFWERVVRLVTLEDYNTRVVMLGTALLGIACGVIGVFLLLRKRSLMGDAISHATLPGIALAFILMTRMGGDGKWLPGLLLGALLSGILGMVVVLLVSHQSRLKEDAALGIVLSVFFGLGVALLGVIQKMSHGHAAGLESFIYGKTASMLANDAKLIAGAAAVIVIACFFLFKEFTALCFDQGFAGSQGLPVLFLDTLMMLLMVSVTVIGLQAVGIILVIALLVIPPASARFWTNRLPRMVAVSATFGGLSCLVGSGLSALIPRLPAGAIIVVVAGTIFLCSMMIGPARGVLFRLYERVSLNRRVARQHVLRGMYEALEELDSPGIREDQLLQARSWSLRQLRRAIRSARRQGLVSVRSDGTFHLTEEGLATARRVVRNHRLWEIYLITHADIAPSQVDRDADRIEHVLGRAMVAKLEELLAVDDPRFPVPPTPHPLGIAPGESGRGG